MPFFAAYMHDLDSQSAKFLKELLDAINASIHNSAEVASALAAMKQVRQEVDIALDITIRQAVSSEDFDASDDQNALLGDRPAFTPGDALFLKSLGIEASYE